MHNATITELWKFPIKGCQGIQVESIEVDIEGVKGDRDFAFWANGKIIDQKCTPKLAAIAASVNDDHTILTLKNGTYGDYEHTIDHHGKKLDSAQVLDKYQSIDQGDAVAEWASKIVGKDIRLVIPGDSWKINLPVESLADMHQKDKKRYFAVSSVSLLNRSSLDALNKWIEPQVGLDRFRSNVVVDGMDAWDEDRMGAIYTDTVELNHMSGAERCVIITTDQKTGERPKNNMLQILKEHRQRPQKDRFASGLLFGSYTSVTKSGVLKVGDVFQHGTEPKRVDTIVPPSRNSSALSDDGDSDKAALAGSWGFTLLDTPMGDQNCKIEFIINEDGISGIVTDSDLINGASEEDEVGLDKCELNGSLLNFVIEIKEPFELPLMGDLEIQDDQMSGTAKLGAIGAYKAKATKL